MINSSDLGKNLLHGIAQTDIGRLKYCRVKEVQYFFLDKDTLMVRGEMIIWQGHSCKLLIRSGKLGFRGVHWKRKPEREDGGSGDRVTFTGHYRSRPLATLVKDKLMRGMQCNTEEYREERYNGYVVLHVV